MGVGWSGVRSGQTREKRGLIRWVGSFVLVDSDRIVKGFLPSATLDFLVQVVCGLGPPSGEFIGDIFLHDLAFCPPLRISPPILTTLVHIC